MFIKQILPVKNHSGAFLCVFEFELVYQSLSRNIKGKERKVLSETLDFLIRNRSYLPRWLKLYNIITTHIPLYFTFYTSHSTCLFYSMSMLEQWLR